MKKLLSLFLVFLLLMGSVCAESTDFTVSQPFLGISGFPVHWEDAFFSGDAHEYRHGLCLLSMAFTLAAMDDAGANNTAPVRDFLDRLGFIEPDIRQYDVRDKDTIGSVMARKSVNGREVIAVAVRAGQYGGEWLSNLEVGDEGTYHVGFESAANQVLERLKDYTQGIASPVLWIVGYSRGAAVANLAAAFAADAGLAPDEDIFCYTLATPKTVMESRSKAHQNIFNIINPADLVPRVPLAEWGFARYGVTLCLPSALAGDAYAQLMPAYQAAYKSITGTEDAVGADASLARMAANTEKGLAFAVPSRWQYVDNYQPLLEVYYQYRDFSHFTGMEQLTFAALAAVVCGKAFQDEEVIFSVSDDVNVLVQNVNRLLQIWQNHAPARYAAWLMVIPGPEAMTNAADTP